MLLHKRFKKEYICSLFLFCAVPSYAAAEHLYAPEGCEFPVKFIEAFTTEERCGFAPESCSNWATLTKQSESDNSRITVEAFCKHANKEDTAIVRKESVMFGVLRLLTHDHMDYEIYSEVREKAHYTKIGIKGETEAGDLVHAEMWVSDNSSLVLFVKRLGNDLAMREAESYTLHSIRHTGEKE